MRRILLLFVVTALAGLAGVTEAAEVRLATFDADVTIPLGHRCMGILPAKARRIADPLEARGLVILGIDRPLVLVGLDWCEVRNDAYDRWREVLAEATGTVRSRVLLWSVHQHDAPVADSGAERALASVGLGGELLDVTFHEQALQRVAAALRSSLATAQPVTHIGVGQARVRRVASNRRIVLPDGRVVFDRGSASGGDVVMRNAPDGLIDPWLKTISFWNQDRPLAAVSAYATHPMSHYGQGEVSADFVGLARRQWQRQGHAGFQIYATGCAGDVTAGKYNDGAPANRRVLADRIVQAMQSAWEATRRHPLQDVELRTVRLALPFHEGAAYTVDALRARLSDRRLPVRDRILAAMGLASRQRLNSGRSIDVPCVNFGPARILLLPAETFVGYQWMAQRIRPDTFVMCIGYGECWPGYIPTRAAFDEHFDNTWQWVADGAPKQMHRALTEVLRDRKPR